MTYYQGSLYLFGGTTTKYTSDDRLYKYDLTAKSWSIIPASNSPLRRYLFNSLLVGSSFYIFPGWNDETLLGDIGTFHMIDLNSPSTWVNVTLDDIGGISTRDSYASAYSGSTAYIFGGWSEAAGIRNDLIKVEFDGSKAKAEQVSGIYDYPLRRKHHTMVTLGTSLFVFGGTAPSAKLELEELSDLWEFDLETETWEAVEMSGSYPSPRSGSASTSIGDRMYLFGGEGGSELYSDLFIYDNISSEWLQVTAEGLPSARKHACMSSHYPYLFMFGGITLNGYSDEVWRIDIKNYESVLLSSGNPIGPMPSAFAGCHIEDEEGDLVFYVYLGETTGETPLDAVYKLNTSDRIWHFQGTITPKSQSAIVKVRDRIVAVAGEQWGLESLDTVHLMEISSGEASLVSKLNFSIYSAACKYYKDSIYIYGGGDRFGEKFRSSVPVHNFYRFDLNELCGEHCNWPCSPGTYQSKVALCEACPEGTYNDAYGALSCKQCPAGTFSRRMGNSSLRQCYPCEEGFYNPTPGSSKCLGCPNGYSCEVGSSSPSLNSQTDNVIMTSQPDLFTPGTEKVDSLSSDLQNGFIGLGVLTMLLLLIFKGKVYSCIASMDLYDDLHNHEDDVPIVKHKNFFGGFFSLLFYVAVLFYLIVAFLVYAWDNVEEIKALVPLVTLEKEYDDIKGDVEITAEFGSYGGVCVTKENECDSRIAARTTGISWESLEASCSFVKSACVVRLLCRGCRVSTGAMVEYQLSEDWSYANYIKSTVSSTSSIPKESSMVQLVVSPASGRVFRGSEPSKVYFELISSVFTSESSEWDSELTGYHISASRASDVGSSTNISEIPGTFGLQLVVYLDLSSTGLLTSRRLKQSALLLFSSILGTYYGLMDIFGFIMEKSEEKWLDYSSKRKRKLEFQERMRFLKMMMQDFGRLPSSEHNVSIMEEASINTPSSTYMSKHTKTSQVHPISQEIKDLFQADLDDFMPWLARKPTS
mmetsp:Transcript_5708/g.10208  ORF Transcript_5708/g.10208 Transcript_5708/m.10208 type:complete len:981 (-) Transcript_5708:36-2978(-)